MNKPIYHFHEKFVFRLPLMPFTQEKLTTADFLSYAKQPVFLEAIYLASPVLYNELIKWHNGQLKEGKEINRLVISLFKYYTRMKSRCTPYGLFAACGTGEWSTSSNITVNNTLKRHTRLDMHYLCALAQQLSKHPAILPFLNFFPNNTIYAFGEQLRYVEYKYKDNKRLHQLSSVTAADYLDKLLTCATDGSTLGTLSTLLVTDEINYEEAEEFVKELIDAQLLISELEPAVTGDEFIHQLITTLKKVNASAHLAEINAIIHLLETVKEQITAIDNQPANAVNAYKLIYEQLKALNVDIEENQLFQTDTYKQAVTSKLDSGIQKQLQEAIDFLNRFFVKTENDNLKKFKENFLSRYEEAEVNLLEALDTETGIGFIEKDTAGINILIDDIHIPPASPTYQLKWNKHTELLHQKLLEAAQTKSYTVSFSEADLAGADHSTVNLPDSLAVMFRLTGDKVYLQSCGGSSAANLLGRFAHGNAAIHNIINTITEHEQRLNEGKLLAEIVHLPESRTGNILLRPVLREYEIPYLSKSALPAEKQLQLNELTIAVRNNRLVLWSRRLNKEIIPRLSTAHNYTYNALPVYQFLCNLQTQQYEKQAIGFDWGALSSMHKFLPRAEYKQVILSRAQWQFTKKDFQLLLDEGNENYPDLIHTWRQQWLIPELVLLADGDNELFVDFNDPLSLQMLVSMIKKRDNITLTEFLFDPDNLLVKDVHGNGYTNECIAIMLKNEKQSLNLYDNKKRSEVLSPIPQRSFSTGSEWLYYKFYCGIKTADKLLVNIIKPLTAELLEKKCIDQFFFIRYADPDVHIRLRLHMCDTSHLGSTISLIHQYLQDYMQQGLIAKVQLDTYYRELERYGANSMELAEFIFYIDSLTVLNLLDLTDGEAGEVIRWQFALRSIDELLSSFGYRIGERLACMKGLSAGFIAEHGDSKELKLQLDGKFRITRKQVEEILNDTADAASEMAPLFELLTWKKQELMPVVDKLMALKNTSQLQVEWDGLITSYIHMMLNRIFKARQRTCEMVVYDLLFRYYKSVVAREKDSLAKVSNSYT